MYFLNFFQSFWIFRNSWFLCGQKLSFIFLFWKTLVHLTLKRSVVKSEFSVRQWIHYSVVSFWLVFLTKKKSAVAKKSKKLKKIVKIRQEKKVGSKFDCPSELLLEILCVKFSFKIIRRGVLGQWFAENYQWIIRKVEQRKWHN